MDKDPPINLDSALLNSSQTLHKKNDRNKNGVEKSYQKENLIQKKERTVSFYIKSIESVNESKFTFAFFKNGLFDKSKILNIGNANQLLSTIEENNGLDIDEPILVSLLKKDAPVNLPPEANIIMFLSLPKLDDPNSINPWISYLLDVIDSWDLSEISLYASSEIYKSENDRSNTQFLERVIETLFSNSKLEKLNWIATDKTKIQILNAGLLAKKKLFNVNTFLTVYH